MITDRSLDSAQVTGEVIRVALLFYLCPVWATILGRWLLGAPMRPSRAITIALGLVGAGIVLGAETGPPVPRAEGEWMALVSGMLFALGATCSRLAPPDNGVVRSCLSFVFAALCAALFLLIAPAGAAPGVTAVPALLLLGLGLTVFWLLPQTWLLIWASGRLDPGRVSLILLLEIVVAAVSAAILTDEPFGWREGIGCLLMLGAGLAEAKGQHAGSVPTATPFASE